MLSKSYVMPTIPAVDIDRAQKFYHDKLGLKVLDSKAYEFYLEAGDKNKIYVYKRGKTKADHTALNFMVDDVEAEVKNLKEKGVEFEEYESGDLKTVNSIATWEDKKAAWFKDTEGNILALANS